MKMHLWAIAVLSALAACVAFLSTGEASSASSGATLTPSVSVTTSENAGTGSTEFTVTVSGLTGTTKFRDLHLGAGHPRKFPEIKAPPEGSAKKTEVVENGANSQTWNVKPQGGGKGIAVYTGTGGNHPEGFGNGTYTFKIHWNLKGSTRAKLRGAVWTATSDGGESVTGSNELDDGTLSLLQMSVTLNDGEDLPAPIGTTTEVSGASEESMAGEDYEIYTSLKLNEEFSDPLGIGIETVSDPVPLAWDLSFSGFQGTLAQDGKIPSASIFVPTSSPGLAQTFHMVLALKVDGDIIFFSDPVEVTITQ